jgi:glycosyltransferase involved in cell wall biosynthesis
LINLSIIIPVYNCEAFLEKGFSHLRSLYTSKISFEIIYVNDGSTDNSLKVLHEIAAENDFIQVLSQDNQGSSGARNTAIEVAQGEYIQFLDADDILVLDLVLGFLNVAIDERLDLLGYQLDIVDEEYIQIGKWAKHPISYNRVMRGTDALIDGYQPSSICVFLFRRSMLIEHNLRIYPKITHMDVEFMTRVMLCMNRVKFFETIAYSYVQRPGSITKPKTKEKKESFLYDEVIIAALMRDNINTYAITDRPVKEAVTKNYNSVVWNLLWSFIIRPKEVDYEFKMKCLSDMKEQTLYPIKGPLKTNFQRLSRIIFNQQFILRKLFYTLK